MTARSTGEGLKLMRGNDTWACWKWMRRQPKMREGGGVGGTRTLDQRIKSPLLYRLSYRPDASEAHDSMQLGV